MQKCAHEHRNINAFYSFHCQSERKVKREDACWEWAARGEPPECEMKMEEMWWISEMHTHTGENRGQKSQHWTSSHLKTCFSSDEPLLAGFPAPEAVPGSVNREKKKNYYSLPQAAYLWIITPLRRLTDMPGELKALAAFAFSVIIASICLGWGRYGQAKHFPEGNKDNIYTSRSAGVTLTPASLFCSTGCQGDTINHISSKLELDFTNYNIKLNAIVTNAKVAS